MCDFWQPKEIPTRQQNESVRTKYKVCGLGEARVVVFLVLSIPFEHHLTILFQVLAMAPKSADSPDAVSPASPEKRSLRQLFSNARRKYSMKGKQAGEKAATGVESPRRNPSDGSEHNITADLANTPQFHGTYNDT